MTPPPARLALADPAELLSQTRVAALLHVRDDAVRALIARGELETVDGKVPRWVLLEWQRSRIERGHGGGSSDGGARPRPRRG